MLEQGQTPLIYNTGYPNWNFIWTMYVRVGTFTKSA